MSISSNIYTRNLLGLLPDILNADSFTNTVDNFYIATDNYGPIKRALRLALMGNMEDLEAIMENNENIRC